MSRFELLYSEKKKKEEVSTFVCVLCVLCVTGNVDSHHRKG